MRRFAGLVRYSMAVVWGAGRRQFLALLALQVIGGLGLGAQVLVAKALLDGILRISHGGGVGGLVLPVVLLVIVNAATSVAGSAQTYLGRHLGEAVGYAMWRRLLDVTTGVELTRFESSEFFDDLQRVQSSAMARPYQVTSGLLKVGGSLAACVGLGAAIVALNPVLLPLLVVGGLPMLVSSRRESRLEFGFVVEQTPRIRLRTYTGLLQTMRDEAKEVRAFGLQRNLRIRFETLYESYLGDLGAHLRRRAVVNMLGTLGSGVLLGGTLLVLVWLISRGSIGVAAAGAAIVAVRMLAGQVQGVFGGMQSIFESGLFIDDFERFLADNPLPPAAPGALLPPRGAARVRAESVAFTYPGLTRPALDDVTIEIGPGEVVALVGENGSGKTTLAKVVAGLYPPSSGVVTWDGTPAGAFRRDAQRDRVAVIFQDFVRYAFTATENIALGRPDHAPDPDAVRRAAAVAGADGFIERLPAAYETVMSRIFAGGGLELSGGQWQRIALARAHYRDADLVILDEPTSALDPRAEHDLFQSLRGTLAGRSALFISHRFSTVRSADRIYVLQDGRVTEHGTHEQLMALGGHYAELFSLQAAAYLDRAAAAQD